jgi:hypothetical protein
MMHPDGARHQNSTSELQYNEPLTGFSVHFEEQHVQMTVKTAA